VHVLKKRVSELKNSQWEMIEMSFFLFNAHIYIHICICYTLSLSSSSTCRCPLSLSLSLLNCCSNLYVNLNAFCHIKSQCQLGFLGFDAFQRFLQFTFLKLGSLLPNQCGFDSLSLYLLCNCCVCVCNFSYNCCLVLAYVVIVCVLCWVI